MGACRAVAAKMGAGLPRRSREAAEAGGAESGEPSAFLISPRRRSRKRRSGSCCASASARSYDCARVRRSARGGGTGRRAPSARGGSPSRSPRARMRVDEREARRGAVAHGDGDGAVQLDDRRRVRAQQHVVEPDDLRPVGRGRVGASACTAAIAACSVYGPNRRDASARSTSVDPSAICARFQSERSCSSSRTSSPSATCARRAASRAAASAPAGPSPPAPAAARPAAGRAGSPRADRSCRVSDAPDDAE